ncbi:unnamed protein product [Caenorhabditis angaria]|uniref:Uncharacterized protein n=1 Tax=Caenorhabditis angaria TaxID=860376 RepID=A0A9P1IR09_9PELO|nr:unnamed protein product [Caenorhabditis angaria]
MTLRKVQWADEEPSTSEENREKSAKTNIYRIPKGSNDNGMKSRTRQLVYVKSYSDYYADHIESILPTSSSNQKSSKPTKSPPKLEKNLSIVVEDNEEEEAEAEETNEQENRRNY